MSSVPCVCRYKHCHLSIISFTAHPRVFRVIIAALYYNPALLLEILDKIQLAGMAGGVFRHFIQQWIHDTDCFIGLHDRKLCVLGLVHLLQMPDNAAVAEQSQQLLPSALLLFDGLKRAYAARDAEEDSEDGDSDEEGLDSELLDSDEDEIDDEGQAYLESLQVETMQCPVCWFILL